MRTLGHLATLFACCLWGALAGWAAALAVRRPEPPPDATLLAYGALTLFGAGYLLGSLIRGRPAGSPAMRGAALTAVAAVAGKLLVADLAAWTAFPIAAAVFGVLCGLVRTRDGACSDHATFRCRTAQTPRRARRFFRGRRAAAG